VPCVAARGDRKPTFPPSVKNFGTDYFHQELGTKGHIPNESFGNWSAKPEPTLEMTHLGQLMISNGSLAWNRPHYS
jgi:hypothetical protein